MDYETVANALAAAATTCTYEDPDGNLTRQLPADGFARELIDPPRFEVGEVEIGPDASFGGPGNRVQEVVFTTRIYTGRASDAGPAHRLLRHFLADVGPGSIKAALEADRTLGGVVDALLVGRRYGYGVYEVAGTDYYGARIEVRVWGRG